MTDDDTSRSLDEQVLDVYESRDGGWWNPDHGDVVIPDGWELLPSGDAYLTRTVKQLGPHWLACRSALGWLTAASVFTYRTVPHPDSDRREPLAV